ncbi:MAG: histidine phosphatase family protein [Alphaproteobacteria bacterium]|nr:histidine phosphatase family protein [Alphaproteobacteria bacterium]MBM3949940.1 histidine phosphatase family protein [Rhodospirillales bacterium]
MDLRWWWVRHAPVVGHRGELNGQKDVPCDTSDSRAFAALAAVLPADAVWVTSHLSRARDTAAAIVAAGRIAPALIIERDFSEQSFGDWAGYTWEEIALRDPAESRRFWTDPVGLAPPGGESFAALTARVAAAIERFSDGRAGDVIAVAHGGVIRAAVALALGLDPKQAMAVAVDNLSLTRLDRIAGGTLRGKGGAWRVVAVNRPPY